ncbi:MAG: hypothetical protein R3313_05130 [Candidatus Saccharimonadales bacterium]|nr:hypothetical protein [Candidatus Saccharimonadales bacterium]
MVSQWNGEAVEPAPGQDPQREMYEAWSLDQAVSGAQVPDHLSSAAETTEPTPAQERIADQLEIEYCDLLATEPD